MITRIFLLLSLFFVNFGYALDEITEERLRDVSLDALIDILPDEIKDDITEDIGPFLRSLGYKDLITFKTLFDFPVKDMEEAMVRLAKANLPTYEKAINLFNNYTQRYAKSTKRAQAFFEVIHKRIETGEIFDLGEDWSQGMQMVYLEVLSDEDRDSVAKNMPFIHRLFSDRKFLDRMSERLVLIYATYSGISLEELAAPEIGEIVVEDPEEAEQDEKESPAPPTGGPCDDAPTPSAKKVCLQMTKWNANAKVEASKKKTVALPPGAAAGFAADLAPIATSLEACVDMACMCQFLAGSRTTPCSVNGKPVTKTIRKEYRMMTDAERQRFHAAFLEFRRLGRFTQNAAMHSSMGMSGGAHGGPAFAGWHREFVKRIEFELKKIDPEVYLPYWDSTLEWRLPRGQDSVLFGDELMGTPVGNVVTGAFKGWTDTSNQPLRRNTGGEGQPFSDPDIAQFLNQATVQAAFAYSPEGGGCPVPQNYYSLEMIHGNVHLWIGGHMERPENSANDPIFYLHHCFVDLLFELTRQKNQDRNRRETEYPPDNALCSNPQHFSGARMAPFNQYRNIDGLSNKYTDELYEYAPRPTCTAQNPSCGSRFLFCDMSHGQARCASKVRVGGSCQGFNANEDSCYNGRCQAGVCVASGPPVTTPAPVTTTRPNTNTVPPQQNDCWNENQCCQSWADRGECQRNAQYMRDFCKASCNFCKPQKPLRDDCTDRHNSCASWSRSGECNRNPDWMAENCRQSCNKCQQTRSQACAAGNQATTPRPAEDKCLSPGCFNEFACCPLWAMQGQCRSNQKFMSCQCKVSCGICYSQDYPYGSCTDYHKDCAAWARNGECQKNPWMEENCRSSCNTCFAQWELPNMCGATSQAGLIAGRRQQNAQQQTPRGGWFQNGWNNVPQGGGRGGGGPRRRPAGQNGWGQQQWGGQGGDGWSPNQGGGGWNNGGLVGNILNRFAGGGWGQGGWGRRRREAQPVNGSSKP
ncbi:unnamed protein product, partial [Mesorhabditis spiculigera]